MAQFSRERRGESLYTKLDFDQRARTDALCRANHRKRPRDGTIGIPPDVGARGSSAVRAGLRPVFDPVP